MRRARAKDGGFVGATQRGGKCHWVEEGGNHTPPPWQGAERLRRGRQVGVESEHTDVPDSFHFLSFPTRPPSLFLHFFLIENIFFLVLYIPIMVSPQPASPRSSQPIQTHTFFFSD